MPDTKPTFGQALWRLFTGAPKTPAAKAPDVYDRLHQRFIDQARLDVQTLNAHLSGEAPLDDADLLATAHRLANGSTVLDYRDVGVVATALEEALHGADDDPDAYVQLLIDELTRAIARSAPRSSLS